MTAPLSAACGGTSPGRRGKCTPVGGGQEVVRRTCLQLCLTTNFAAIDAGTLDSPRGGAVEMPVKAARLRGEHRRPPAAPEREAAFLPPSSCSLRLSANMHGLHEMHDVHALHDTPKAAIMQNMHALKTMQTMHFMHPGRGVREKHAEIAG